MMWTWLEFFGVAIACLVALGVVVLLTFALVCLVIACTKKIKEEVDNDGRTEQSRR